MDKNTIKQIILAQQQFVSTVPVVQRSYKLEREVNYVLVGMRRAGKTFLMYQYIKELLAAGHSAEEILFINFEDERINDITKGELHELLEAYRELYPHEPYIFLDEIQNIDGWEHFARRLADEKRHVMVTGSNAKMLSREIASTLGGRYMIKEVYPFSFAEYVRWSGLTLSKNWIYSPARADVARLFTSYLYYGGISECFSVADKRGWLTSLFQKILYSDVVVHNRIRNDKSLNMLVKKLADSVLQPTTMKRLQNLLSAAGQKSSHETVSQFVEFLHEAYLIFSISNYAATATERESQKKHYFYDNGILNLFLLSPNPKLLENVVAIALRQRYGEYLYYYSRNIEVDFMVPDKNMAIQVSYDMSDGATEKREVAALLALNRFRTMERNIIITRDEERTIRQGDLIIEVLPVWKWLLE